MPLQFFLGHQLQTEDYQLGALSGAAGSSERARSWGQQRMLGSWRLAPSLQRARGSQPLRRVLLAGRLQLVLHQIGFGKEEPRLSLRILIRVRRVNRVPLLGLRVELSNRPRLGFGGIGGSDCLAEGGDGV